MSNLLEPYLLSFPLELHLVQLMIWEHNGRVIIEALSMLISATEPGTIIDSDQSWKS